MRKARLLKTVTWIWICALIAVSLQPIRPGAESPVHQMHRHFHFAAFSLTAFLLWRLLPGIKAALVSIAIGLFIEVMQYLLYHGPMEWWDVRDNTISAIVTILLLHTARALINSQKRARSNAQPTVRL